MGVGDLMDDDEKRIAKGLGLLIDLVEPLDAAIKLAERDAPSQRIEYQQAAGEWWTPRIFLDPSKIDCMPCPPPSMHCGPTFDHAIFGARRTRNKNGRIVFEITVGREGGFVAESIVLAPDRGLETWAIISLRCDSAEEQIEGRMPAQFCGMYRSDRDFVPKFQVTAHRTIRIELRRAWAPRPRLVITRSSSRWVAIRGQKSRPAPRERPDHCAMMGVVTRRR